MKHALFIQRAAIFSPSLQDKDAAILRAVEEEMKKVNISTTLCSEESLESTTLPSYDILIHMTRSREALSHLVDCERKGTPVLNSASSILCLRRAYLLEESRSIGLPVPPFAICERGDLSFPFWWKRDDGVSHRADDVVLVRSEEEWKEVQKRGIARYVVEKHIEGDLLKFYSVQGTSFFHWNYPTYSKFGKERENGSAQGYQFDEKKMKELVDLLAEAMGLQVFGGDAIVDKEGRFYLIDFNDWPSFSSCREEAAKAIAEVALEALGQSEGKR